MADDGPRPDLHLPGERDDVRLERQVRGSREHPRRPDERQRLRHVGRIQRQHALARLRRSVTRPRQYVAAEQDHRREREEQSGPADRHGSLGQRVSHLRQRRERGQGPHRPLRLQVDRRRRDVERTRAVRNAHEPGLRVPDVLLQHLGRAVPRRRLVPGARVGSSAEPARRVDRGHSRAVRADVPLLAEARPLVDPTHIPGGFGDRFKAASPARTGRLDGGGRGTR